jgi:hypothetical protein
MWRGRRFGEKVLGELFDLLAQVANLVVNPLLFAAEEFKLVLVFRVHGTGGCHGRRSFTYLVKPTETLIGSM